MFLEAATQEVQSVGISNNPLFSEHETQDHQMDGPIFRHGNLQLRGRVSGIRIPAQAKSRCRISFFLIIARYELIRLTSTGSMRLLVRDRRGE